MSGVDVLELLRKIAAGDGDVELMAMRCHGAVSELIEAAKDVDRVAMMKPHRRARLRAALTAVGVQS